uniref:Uncharacterized protein n=1 Tax=Palpitomonas bilix TaxID=652834 RepID=A0A7S3G1X5_9EUKA
MELIYTPQQIAGYKGYYHSVRIGNWSEELELQESRLKDFLYRKEHGELALHKAERKLQQHLGPVELSKTEDGRVRFDSVALLFNHRTESVVATDLNDRTKAVEEAYSTTTSWYGEPCARNAVTIKKYDSSDDDLVLGIPESEKDVLHYGQKFHIVASSQLRPEADGDLFLRTQAATPLVSSKYSHFQEVSFVHIAHGSKPRWETVWEVVAADAEQRVEMEGMPVSVETPVLIKHCATGAYLSSDFIAYKNDFGTEYELSGMTNLDSKKVGVEADLPTRLYCGHEINVSGSWVGT